MTTIRLTAAEAETWEERDGQGLSGAARAFRREVRARAAALGGRVEIRYPDGTCAQVVGDESVQRAAALDRRRGKPRVAIVMAPDVRGHAERLAAAKALSLSAWLEQLVRAEVERERRRERR